MTGIATLGERPESNSLTNQLSDPGCTFVEEDNMFIERNIQR